MFSSPIKRAYGVLKDGHIPPSNIFYSITTGCNLHCSYCVNGTNSGFFNNISFPTKDQLKNLVNNLLSFGYPNLEFTISGGEPTIVPNLEFLVSYFRDLDIKTPIVIYSNGINFKTIRNLIQLPNVHFLITIHSKGFSPNLLNAYLELDPHRIQYKLLHIEDTESLQGCLGILEKTGEEVSWCSAFNVFDNPPKDTITRSRGNLDYTDRLLNHFEFHWELQSGEHIVQEGYETKLRSFSFKNFYCIPYPQDYIFICSDGRVEFSMCPYHQYLGNANMFSSNFSKGALPIPRLAKCLDKHCRNCGYHWMFPKFRYKEDAENFLIRSIR